MVLPPKTSGTEAVRGGAQSPVASGTATMGVLSISPPVPSGTETTGGALVASGTETTGALVVALFAGMAHVRGRACDPSSQLVA